MSNFNKIAVNSNLKINTLEYASLCFRDDVLISSRYYSLIDGTLTLLDNPGDLLSLYYNNGVAHVYEFTVKLYQPGIQLNTVDNNNKQVQNLVASNLLVFVDGVLQTPDDYFVLDDNILAFTHEYTNNPNKKFTVIVYSIDDSSYFIRETIPLTYEVPGDRSSLNLNNITLNYNINNTIIFANGKKIAYNNIEYTDPATLDDLSTTPTIKINIDANLAESIERIEYIQFNSKKTNTKSLNFSTTPGYLTYGPFDDFGSKVTEKYDTIVTFSDQVKVLIDNIRPGFIIKEENYEGELLIVDNNFETSQVKCLTITPFRYNEYLANGYYLEVPEYTKITKYLAEFDKKFTFLPEILDIFQRLLLDEINDSVERLRNIRNIHKVDSININKLLSLLGFNVNIKMLTKKQRMELLEELNEFYRKVGTRDSYNVLNILQNDLKLINMDQLFTPHYPRSKESTLYNYDWSLSDGGEHYQLGQYLQLNDSSSVKFRVSDINEDGEILALEPESELEGYEEKNGTYSLIPTGSFEFTINSDRPAWSYVWTVTESQNYSSGINLKTIRESKNDPVNYSLTVDSVNQNGQIVAFTPHQETTGANAVTLTGRKLYEDIPLPSLKVTPTYHPEILAGQELVYEYYEGGRNFSTILNPGVYRVVMSGAGGSGAAADSSIHSENDMDCYNGYAGELREVTITVPSRTVLTGKIGQGGGAVKARAGDGRGYLIGTNMGNGFSNGADGITTKNWWIIPKQSDYDTDKGSYVQTLYINGIRQNGSYRIRTAMGVWYTGQGGGSTGFTINNETYEAKGGNGGNVFIREVVERKYKDYGYARIKVNEYTSFGGTGGAGGTTTGNGAPGGARPREGGNTNFTSGNGANGYIKIYKLPLTYDYQIINPERLNPVTSLAYETLDSFNQQFRLTYANNNWVLSPSYGNISIDSNDNIFELRPINENRSARLNISSVASQHYYDVAIRTINPEYLRPGFVLKNSSTDPVQFTYTVTDVNGNDIQGVWSPQTGSDELQVYRTPAYLQTGTGARVLISSVRNTQKNEDREYIDFYKKEQVGAVKKKEYRIDTIDYGSITMGTPGSPEWWVVGNPDINYGEITVEDTTRIDYGEISDEIIGEWVEWWEWDRKNIWYPTNHVELEMKLPVGVNFEDYIQRFIDQFYGLASTVIFIHTIVQSFYFGKDITSGTDPNELTGASFGIMTAPPYTEEWMCVTSDPSIQILKPDYRLTILTNPNDAEVTLMVDGEVIHGNVVTVPEDTEVAYTVEHVGYNSTSGTVTVTSTMTLNIALIPRTFTLTLTPTPIDANVRITGNDTTVEGEGTQSISVPYGTIVQYLVQKGNMESWDLGPVDSQGIPITNEDEGRVRDISTLTKDMGLIPLEGTGYIPQSGIYTVEDDTTLEIELEPIPNE